MTVRTATERGRGAEADSTRTDGAGVVKTVLQNSCRIRAYSATPGAGGSARGYFSPSRTDARECPLRRMGFASPMGIPPSRRAPTTGRRASRPARSPGASAASAKTRGSVSSGIRSPPFSLVESGQSELNARREVYGLECSPYTMPRQAPGRRTRRALALNTSGSPPWADSGSSA